jgi:hypothetical protein
MSNSYSNSLRLYPSEVSSNYNNTVGFTITRESLLKIRIFSILSGDCDFIATQMSKNRERGSIRLKI